MRLDGCHFSVWMCICNPTVKCMFISHYHLHDLEIFGISFALYHDLVFIFTLTPACKIPGISHSFIIHQMTNIASNRLIRWYFLPIIDICYCLKLFIKHFSCALILGKFLIEPNIFYYLLYFRSEAWKCSRFFRFPA